MKYTLANPALDSQIAEIKRKIKLSMNGIVSGLMTQNGIFYKTNYGVSIPRIKEIASIYTPDHEFAQRLWNLQIRETMILSTFLEPVDKFDRKSAQTLVEKCNQIEIVEQACMNLFSKLQFSNTLCVEWIVSENEWIQITGFMLAARIFEKLNQSDTNTILLQALRKSETNNFHLYKAVGLCLSRFCRKDKETAAYILKEITAFSKTSSISQHYITAEVKQEILFLNDL